MKSGKRSFKIDVRFTEEEFTVILGLEKTLGLKRADIIRMHVMRQSGQLIVNARDLIAKLDVLGTELGRIGNNINQLARYANTLNKRGLLSPQIIERYNRLIADYIIIQQKLEVVLRKIIRAKSQ